MGPLAAMVVAISVAVARAWPLGTRRLTRPAARASSAFILRPVKISSLASGAPRIRGSSWVPPMPGKMPSVVSGTPNTAVSLATMKSDRIASSQPPARAKPSTAAITGTGQRALLEDHVLGAPRLVGHPVALLEIAARAERLVARAREDHGARVGIARERVEAGEQVLAHRGVHRVHLLRAIERDRDDVAVRRILDEQVPIGHCTTPRVWRLRTSSSV